MRKILVLILVLLLGFITISCGKEDNETQVTVPLEPVYDIHTELQNNYLNDSYTMYGRYATGTKELSKPLPITIKWDLAPNIKYSFHLSEEETFNSKRTFETQTNEIALLNLKINTPYFWYVSYLEGGVETVSEVNTFTINTKAPRNLDIEGVTNVRDLGGYNTLDGKVVKQGLIYRSARFNENESTTLLITSNGIKEMVEVLGVKSELDVRQTEDNENGGITSSPLGESVNYFSIPMISSGKKLLLNKDIFKDVFAVFGDEENYPIVIHCSIGTDRTGVVCFLINAMLGVGEEDLYRDYLFSNFADIGRRRTPGDIDEYLTEIKLANGNTLREKTYNYLVGIGVDSTDLDNIKRIMLQ